MNRVCIVGRLTREPELRFTANQRAVCNFGIAFDEYPGATDPVFADVTVWNAPAENCNKYLKKGDKVDIDGRLKLERWANEAGEKRQQLVIVADSVGFPDKNDK